MESISTATTIQIGLVITLMGAAASFGVMWTKVEIVKRTMDRLEEKFEKLNTILTEILLKGKP